MRISRMSIKGFRSISNIEDFQFLDKGITCFIGPNGSGKSNILQAISHVLADDQFIQQDYFQKLGKKKISIELELLLEPKDKEKYEEDSSILKDIASIRLQLESELSGTKDLELYAIDSSNNTLNTSSNHLSTLSKSIIDRFNSIDLGALFGERANEITPTVQTNVQNLSSKISGGNYGVEGEVELLRDQLSTIRNSSHPEAKEIKRMLNEIGVLSSLRRLLDTIKDDISIEILDFTKEYGVEDEVPPSELENRLAHPFLYDLLTLSGTAAGNYIGQGGLSLTNTRDAASKELTEQLSRNWPSHKMEYVIGSGEGEKIFFGARTKQGRVVGLAQLSDGEKWYLRFYTRLAIAKNDSRNIIWLFDEPGRDLHATSQVDLKEFFENVAEDAQIIYSTHQPMMIPWQRLERLFVVDNVDRYRTPSGKKLQGTIIHKRFWKDAEENGVIVSPLREALGLIVGEQLLTGKEHIIVEGVSDYFYLSGWIRFFQNTSTAKVWKESFSPLHRAVVPAGGIDNIPLYALFLQQKAGDKINCVSVPDSSRDQRVVEKVFEGSGMMRLKETTVSFSMLSGKENLKEIENLFHPKEFIALSLEYYQEVIKQVAVPESIDEPKTLEKYDGKITTYIENKIREVNPHFSKIDKIGVATHAYQQLSRAKTAASCPFSEDTRKIFHTILKEINRQFGSTKK